MTVNHRDSVLGDPELFSDVAEILGAVTGEGPEWVSAISPDARLEGDLRMESIEMAAFGQALRDRFGPRIDLGAFLAGLELDQLIGLTVADVLGYLAEGRTPGGNPGQVRR